jgi:hypothetical protein
MPPLIPLDPNEKAKIQEAISTSSNLSKIYHAGRGMLYYARAGTNQWYWAGIHGALVFALNTSSNTLHFWMVDLYGDRVVRWHYELHDGVELYQEKSVPFFLSFQCDVRCRFNSHLFAIDRVFRNVGLVLSS